MASSRRSFMLPLCLVVLCYYTLFSGKPLSLSTPKMQVAMSGPIRAVRAAVITRDHVSQTLKELIAVSAGISASEISGSQSFAELGIDSLEVVEILMQAEQEFGVKLDDDVSDAKEEDTENVDKLTDLIMSKLA